MTIVRKRINRIAEPKATTTRRCARWNLQRLAIDKAFVSAIERALGLGWNTVNVSTLAVGVGVAIVFDRPGHPDRVRHLGRRAQVEIPSGAG